MCMYATGTEEVTVFENQARHSHILVLLVNTRMCGSTETKCTLVVWNYEILH